MRNRSLYILAICICIAVVIFAVYVISNDKDTEFDTVKYDSVDVSLSGQTNIYTDCVLLSAERDSVILPLCRDGELVKKEQTVAITYSSEAQSLEIIRQTADRLYILTQANITQSSMTLEQADGTISDLTSQIYAHKDGDDVKVLYKLQRDLHILYRKRDIITNKKQNYSDEIESLWDKIESITAVHDVTVRQIKSPCDGYYYSQAYSSDAALSSQSIDDLTFDALVSSDILPESNSQYAGKILKDPKWYFTLNAERSDASLFTVGQTYKFEAEYGKNQMNAEFYRSVYGAGNDCVLIFSCTDISDSYVFTPNENFEVIASQLYGATVCEDALYFLNGVQGVYVLRDGVLHFIPTDIIHSENGAYMIQPSNGETLDPYDRVAVGSKDIYDGKVID